MTPFDRHLQAAQGFLELGLPLDANEELEQIEPEMRTLSPVLAMRVAIYQKLEAWGLMEVVAGGLCKRHPHEPEWHILWAYATRGAFSLERASGVLMNAVQRFPEEPTIHYNLACYEAQLGNLELARGRLAEAIRLEPMYREMALNDPDLVVLQRELREPP